MEAEQLIVLHQKLDEYLASTKGRRTHERYSILDACYEEKGMFTMQELNERLEKKMFRVSRATLYNTLNLLVSLRLVLRHNFADITKYEPAYIASSHLWQICSMCGKISEVNSQLLSKTIQQVKFRRFKQERYTLFAYGICSSCQAKLTRKKASKQKKI